MVSSAPSSRSQSQLRARNCDWLRELGADETIDYNQVDCCQLDRQFDAFLDCYCNRSFSEAKEVLAERGAYVTLTVKPSLLVQPLLNCFRRQSAKAVVVRNHGQQLRTLSKWVEAGR